MTDDAILLVTATGVDTAMPPVDEKIEALTVRVDGLDQRLGELVAKSDLGSLETRITDHIDGQLKAMRDEILRAANGYADGVTQGVKAQVLADANNRVDQRFNEMQAQVNAQLSRIETALSASVTTGLAQIRVELLQTIGDVRTTTGQWIASRDDQLRDIAARSAATQEKAIEAEADIRIIKGDLYGDTDRPSGNPSVFDVLKAMSGRIDGYAAATATGMETIRALANTSAAWIDQEQKQRAQRREMMSRIASTLWNKSSKRIYLALFGAVAIGVGGPPAVQTLQQISALLFGDK